MKQIIEIELDQTILEFLNGYAHAKKCSINTAITEIINNLDLNIKQIPKKFILDNLSNNENVSIGTLITKTNKAGYSDDSVFLTIDKLKRDGEIYESERGFLRKI